jgi:hypothetical protein
LMRCSIESISRGGGRWRPSHVSPRGPELLLPPPPSSEWLRPLCDMKLCDRTKGVWPSDVRDPGAELAPRAAKLSQLPGVWGSSDALSLDAATFATSTASMPLQDELRKGVKARPWGGSGDGGSGERDGGGGATTCSPAGVAGRLDAAAAVSALSAATFVTGIIREREPTGKDCGRSGDSPPPLLLAVDSLLGARSAMSSIGCAPSANSGGGTSSAEARYCR